MVIPVILRFLPYMVLNAAGVGPWQTRAFSTSFAFASATARRTDGDVLQLAALEWFECARTELLRAAGIAYAEMERRGVLLPLVEAHVKYQGRARYDDELRITAVARMDGKATMRFDVSIAKADGGAAVASGYTVHAIADASGRPTRTPQWVVDAIEKRPKAGGAAAALGYTDDGEEGDDACPFCHGKTCVGACRD